MQYFYLLNNKDVYGIDGSLLGNTLTPCIIVDYFKRIGVPEGTIDINIGGLNGCYEYRNDTLTYKAISCGVYFGELTPPQPSCNQEVSFTLNQCRCSTLGISIFATIYYTPNPCVRLARQIQQKSFTDIYFPPQLPNPNWNVPTSYVGCSTTSAFPRRESFAQLITPQNIKYWVRYRKECDSIGLYGPWTEGSITVTSLGGDFCTTFGINC